MGNFLRRSLAFIMGMIFGFVALATSIVIAGYYAYKNLKLSAIVSEETDLGEFGKTTIEELVALIMSATSDPSSYTFEKLEQEYGLKVTDVLTSFGFNVDAMHPDDIKAFGKISPFMMTEDIIDNLGFGVVFGLLPKNDNGKYPVFSEGTRSKLRSYTLGEVFGVDSQTGAIKLLSVLSPIKLGGVLSSTFDESYDDTTAEYTYTIADGGMLETLGNLPIEIIVNLTSGEEFDFAYELCEGSLSDLGETTVYELIGMEEGDDQLVSSFGNKMLKDLFAYDDGEYTFDVMLLLNDIKVGTLMGMTECSENNCTVDHNSHDYGWYNADGELVDRTDIAGEIMNSLYDITIEELTNGTFEITTLTSGIYLGKALGYTIDSNDGYCVEGCNEEHHGEGCENGCDVNHAHTYYWVDKSGNFVGAMNNGLSNISLDDVMNGELDVENVLGKLKVGELMGMTYCDGECELSHTHKTGWYDGNGNIISGDNIGNEISLKLYDMQVSDLMNGEFDMTELTEGIYFGKALGYTIGSNDGYCDEDCNEEHTHDYYWVDENYEFVGKMYNNLSNQLLSDAMNGELDIENVLGEIKVGELMGMTYCDGNECEIGQTDLADHTHKTGWYDGDGHIISGDNLGEEITIKLYDKSVSDLMNGDFDTAELSDGIYLGKAFGYTIGSYSGYCVEDCDVVHSHTYYWVDEDDLYVGKLDNSLSNIALVDAMNGKLDIQAVIGKLMIGELMGLNYCDGEKCDLDHTHTKGWYDEDEKLIDHNDLNATDKILYDLYDSYFEDILNGTFHVEDAIKKNDLYVGDLMGYTKCTGDETCHIDHTEHETGWYKVDEENNTAEKAPNIENAFGDIELGDMLDGKANFQSKINDLYLEDVVNVNDSKVFKSLAKVKIEDLSTEVDKLKIGEIMGYKYCDEASCEIGHTDHAKGWYDESGALVKGIYKTLSDYSINQIANGELENLTIDDIIDTKNNAVLSLLKGSTLSSVADDANVLKLGAVMGYKYCDGTSCEIGHADHDKGWYEYDTANDGYKLVSGLNGKMSDYTIEAVSNGELGGDAFINSLVIGDVIKNPDSGAFGLIYTGELEEGGETYDSVSEVPVSELSERMTKGVQEATYVQLEVAEIELLSDADEDKINLFYNTSYQGDDKSEVEDGGWVNVKTLPDVISDIINTFIS